MKTVYGNGKNNAGRLVQAHDMTKCHNCGAKCQRGEYSLEYWNGYDKCYEAMTVCVGCHSLYATEA